jgi:tRNA A37 threonylcarbamoyladenosine synthetase subunit TsaC/SUA5/YrdC
VDERRRLLSYLNIRVTIARARPGNVVLLIAAWRNNVRMHVSVLERTTDVPVSPVCSTLCSCSCSQLVVPSLNVNRLPNKKKKKKKRKKEEKREKRKKKDSVVKLSGGQTGGRKTRRLFSRQ